MSGKLLLVAGLVGCAFPVGAFAQDYRHTVTVEVYLPQLCNY